MWQSWDLNQGILAPASLSVIYRDHLCQNHWEVSSKWRFLGSYCILPKPESQGMESRDISSSSRGDSSIHQSLRITAKRCLHKGNEFTFNVQNGEELFFFLRWGMGCLTTLSHSKAYIYIRLTTNSGAEGGYHGRVWGSVAARSRYVKKEHGIS